MPLGPHTSPEESLFIKISVRSFQFAICDGGDIDVFNTLSVAIIVLCLCLSLGSPLALLAVFYGLFKSSFWLRPVLPLFRLTSARHCAYKSKEEESFHGTVPFLNAERLGSLAGA